MTKATLYVFHGSPKTTCFQEMTALGEELIAETNELSEVAFLAHATNTIPQQARSLAAKGAEEIYLQPVLLQPAVHFHRDLPKIAAQENELGISFQIGECIGDAPAVLNALRTQIETIDEPNACCVLLAHGSCKYPEVEDRLRQLISVLQKTSPVPIWDSYLLTNQHKRSFEERIDRLAQRYSHVFILPYFIFYGHLLEKIAKIVDDRKKKEKRVTLMETLDLAKVKQALLKERG